MCAFVVISGNTEIPARNLYNHIQKLSQSDPDEEMTAMEQEFSVSAATRNPRRLAPTSGHATPLLIACQNFSGSRFSDILK